MTSRYILLYGIIAFCVSLISCQQKNDYLGDFDSQQMCVEILNDKYFLKDVHLMSKIGVKTKELIYSGNSTDSIVELPRMSVYENRESVDNEACLLIFTFTQKENKSRYVQSIISTKYYTIFKSDTIFSLYKLKS